MSRLTLQRHELSVFDDVKSIIHFLVGLTTSVLRCYIPLLSLAIIALYIMYEVEERDSELNRLGDFVEFVMGFLAGLVFIPA